MKIGAAEVLRTYARPDPARLGLLIYGNDAMRVALKRQEVIAAVLGPEGEAEMRLARLAAADLRRDPAALPDALKAQGFFPGPRVAFVEEATDSLAPLLQEAMADWRPGDALQRAYVDALRARPLPRRIEGQDGDSVVGVHVQEYQGVGVVHGRDHLDILHAFIMAAA